MTEEVWTLAGNMTGLQTALSVLTVLFIGYGALYKADKGRDADDEKKEPSFLGVPVRYLSLLAVSYGSVALLVFITGAASTFEASTAVTARAVSIAAIFSVIGAATADSIF